MTDSIWGERPPNAPDSPQWWAVSSVLLQLDGMGEDFDLHSVEGWEAATNHVLDGMIKPSEMSYAAQQRAFKTIGVETYQDIVDNMDDVALAVAAWMDGFVAAIMAYERLKELKDET